MFLEGKAVMIDSSFVGSASVGEEALKLKESAYALKKSYRNNWTLNFTQEIKYEVNGVDETSTKA